MCLKLSINDTAKFIELLKSKPGQKISVWKLLLVQNSEEGGVPFLGSPYQTFRPTSWKVGVNTSNRQELTEIIEGLSPNEIESSEIFYGFHVYVNYKTAVTQYNQKKLKGAYTIAKFTGKLEDFVGVSEQDNAQEAVFNKLSLDSKTKKAALAKGKLNKKRYDKRQKQIQARMKKLTTIAKFTGKLEDFVDNVQQTWF